MEENEAESGNNRDIGAEGVFVDESYMKAHQKKLDIKNQRKIFQNQAFKFFEYCKSIAIVLLALGVFIFLILWGLSLFNEKEIRFVTPSITLPNIPQLPASSNLHFEAADEPQAVASANTPNGKGSVNLEESPAEPQAPEVPEVAKVPGVLDVPEEPTGHTKNIGADTGKDRQRDHTKPQDISKKTDGALTGNEVASGNAEKGDVTPSIEAQENPEIKRNVVLFDIAKNSEGEDIQTGFEYKVPFVKGGPHGIGDYLTMFCYSEQDLDGVSVRINYWRRGSETPYDDKLSHVITRETFNANKSLCETKK